MKIIIIIAGCLLAASAAWAGSNMVVNGHFNDTNEFLRGWKYNYEDTQNEWFALNHTYITITNEGPKLHALSLRANDFMLGNQGVQLDSYPIPVAPGGRYKLTVCAKTTQPDCRILVEGYRWKPGVKPHANPKLEELRKCYRFAQVFFGAEKAGDLGGIKSEQGWTRASQTFPDEKLSKMAQDNLNKVQFLVVHILAIGNWVWPLRPNDVWSYLYVDEVALERINK